MRPRRAASVALRIASGTSRALPWPKPTRPFRSPTTTRAAKPKRLPPFTTLATRLMLTSFSVNSVSSRSRDCRSLSPRVRRSPWVRAMMTPLEIETALAGGIGQGFYPTVKKVGAAIEHDFFDPGCERSLRHQLADGIGSSGIGAGFKVGLQRAIKARSRRQGPSRHIIDDLGIDVLGRAENREARPVVAETTQIPPHPLAPAQKE